MPFEAPVTTATLFVSLFIFLPLSNRDEFAHFDIRLIDEARLPEDSAPAQPGAGLVQAALQILTDFPDRGCWRSRKSETACRVGRVLGKESAEGTPRDGRGSIQVDAAELRRTAPV